MVGDDAPRQQRWEDVGSFIRERAGFLDPDPDVPDPRRSIRADRGLTEAQKQTLVQAYESFVAQNGARPGRPDPQRDAPPADEATP